VPTSNWRGPLFSLSLGLWLPLVPAHACGPDFPLRLLSDRAQSLNELPESNFAFELSRLAPANLAPNNPAPTTNPAVIKVDVEYWADRFHDNLELREHVEQSQLPAEQAALIGQLRQLTDARQAERQGAALPAELRLYSAGAVAFAQGEDALASEYFQRLLALPAAQRPLRSTWAAYSLARLATYASFPPTTDDDAEPAAAPALAPEAAASARSNLILVRSLADAGFADPLDLRLASLGEQARIAKSQGDWSGAIELYASQLQQGSMGGYSSLKMLAGELARMPEPQLLSLLPELQVQQLLTAYLISHAGWSYEGPSPTEQRLVQLLLRSDIANLANADRLAALSYQAGQYDNAAGLLTHAGDSGLAWWLRAKLALRAGDPAAASAAYAKAAKAFPQDEDWGTRRGASGDLEQLKPQCRVEGESALLALNSGDYLAAFTQLYSSGEIYWLDSAVVAERVLSLDELKTYVDANVSAPPALSQEAIDNYQPRPVAASLRALLGRRLLRAERYDEASAYFDSPQLQQAARDYGAARRAATQGWDRIGRAQALYAAAELARQLGMELLGYEMSPDFAFVGGNYSLDNNYYEPLGPPPAANFPNAGEARRQDASQAQPNQRFHYRAVAAELANQAADLLPARSQAFAASLCQASSWLIDTDSAAAQRYYQRYIEQGALVPWAANFARNCPEPDFAGAREHLWQYRATTLREAFTDYRWAFLAALSVLAGGIFRRRQTKRNRAQEKPASAG
jgi:hypothetical protein